MGVPIRRQSTKFVSSRDVEPRKLVIDFFSRMSEDLPNSEQSLGKFSLENSGTLKIGWVSILGLDLEGLRLSLMKLGSLRPLEVSSICLETT